MGVLLLHGGQRRHQQIGVANLLAKRRIVPFECLHPVVLPVFGSPNIGQLRFQFTSTRFARVRAFAPRRLLSRNLRKDIRLGNINN